VPPIFSFSTIPHSAQDVRLLITTEMVAVAKFSRHSFSDEMTSVFLNSFFGFLVFVVLPLRHFCACTQRKTLELVEPSISK
jgi:hypothetical protein